jgi:hypothetical protein
MGGHVVQMALNMELVPSGAKRTVSARSVNVSGKWHTTITVSVYGSICCCHGNHPTHIMGRQDTC